MHTDQTPVSSLDSLNGLLSLHITSVLQLLLEEMLRFMRRLEINMYIRPLNMRIKVSGIWHVNWMKSYFRSLHPTSKNASLSPSGVNNSR